MTDAVGSARRHRHRIENGGTSVAPIRIHLGDMPPMLRAIVDDLLSTHADFLVVGHTAPGEDPLMLARREGADIVIAEDRSQSGTSSLELIMSGPPLCIFAITEDGRNAVAVDIVRRPVDLEFGRNAAFADAIRSAATGL